MSVTKHPEGDEAETVRIANPLIICELHAAGNESRLQPTNASIRTELGKTSAPFPCLGPDPEARSPRNGRNGKRVGGVTCKFG
jgi:hypothetical protein